jgi:hypothetical protein
MTSQRRKRAYQEMVGREVDDDDSYPNDPRRLEREKLRAAQDLAKLTPPFIRLQDEVFPFSVEKHNWDVAAA